MKLHEKWVALLANAGSPTEANNDREQYTEISLTALGIRFVEACKPPVRARE